MRKAFFILVFICASLSVVWAASFEDSENGYKLEYPLGWSASKMSEEVVKGNIFKDKITGVQVRIYDKHNMSLDSYSKWFSSDFIKQMQDRWGGIVKVIKRDNTMMAGYECIITSYDFTRGDGQLRFLKTYLFDHTGNKVYVLQCGTTMDERTVNEPIINSIANSFSFTH